MTDEQDARMICALETIADHLACIANLLARIVEEPKDEDSDDWALRVRQTPW